MDYEKSYKEALERARSGMQIDEVFPELHESEDERIRRTLIQLVYDAWDGRPTAEVSDERVYNACLAYLEKQKEQKPLICDGEIEDRKRDIVAAIRKYYPADYAEYLTSFLKGLSPEDNSEDEYGQEMLGFAYKLMYEHIPENLRTKEFWDSLKFMREYTGRVAIIHSYKKPAEWSEEDEEMIERICANLEYLVKEAGCDSKLKVKLEERIKWMQRLKSLRPQPHWKPSQEQMKALENVIKCELSAGLHTRAKILQTLQNDLKSYKS